MRTLITFVASGAAILLASAIEAAPDAGFDAELAAIKLDVMRRIKGDPTKRESA